jgi:hypothetical protein
MGSYISNNNCPSLRRDSAAHDTPPQSHARVTVFDMGDGSGWGSDIGTRGAVAYTIRIVLRRGGMIGRAACQQGLGNQAMRQASKRGPTKHMHALAESTLHGISSSVGLVAAADVSVPWSMFRRFQTHPCQAPHDHDRDLLPWKIKWLIWYQQSYRGIVHVSYSCVQTALKCEPPFEVENARLEHQQHSGKTPGSTGHKE